jgi:hypothetical protein
MQLRYRNFIETFFSGSAWNFLADLLELGPCARDPSPDDNSISCLVNKNTPDLFVLSFKLTDICTSERTHAPTMFEIRQRLGEVSASLA